MKWWKKVTDGCFRLDDTWTVRLDGNLWYAYRGNAACLFSFRDATRAMQAAEKLREAQYIADERDAIKREAEL